jgi:hypothetical protein
MSLGDMSLATLASLGDLHPTYARVVQRMLVASYPAFVDLLHKDIDACVGILEEDPGARGESGEDFLTTEIAGMLRCMSYDARREERVGGHADLVVRHAQGYLWVCEAKVHGAYDHLLQGFNQLVTRYSLGTPNCDLGGVLIYIRNKNAAAVVANWKTHLTVHGGPGLVFETCNARDDLAFYSTHNHERTGRPFKIRHMGVVLNFDPQDKAQPSTAGTGSHASASAPPLQVAVAAILPTTPTATQTN